MARDVFPLPLDTEPMEAAAHDALPEGEGWQYEPKWDGFRCLAFRAGDAVDLRAKSGKPLARYFPEVAAALAALKPDPFVIDGELTITVDGALSFDALQMRLHPAESRVRKLAAQTPARLVVFDALHTPRDGALMQAPLTKRRAALERFARDAGKAGVARLSSFTRDRAEAEAWLMQAGGAIDGVVAKRLDAPYAPGERAMVKVKRLRTADCVVGGWRTATGGDLVGSLLLGLYDDEGLLNHVGFVSG
ncbi:MAG TPA: ATP-dependent DNA ligase, partial [Beijerinckiaceae bacterium]